jgi:hypothetical protein
MDLKRGKFKQKIFQNLQTFFCKLKKRQKKRGDLDKRGALSARVSRMGSSPGGCAAAREAKRSPHSTY